MFNYSQWLVDFLAKAAGHKYIKRVPYMSGGKTRYRYIYKVTHMAGGKHVLDPEHMVVNAAFMLSSAKGSEVHAHITKVDGDMVTYRLDDGPRKGELVTESKGKLAERLNEEHGVHEALAGAREKQAKVVADLKERGASEKQVAREQARLERLSVSAPAPEAKSEEPKKRATKKPAGVFTFEVEGMNAKGLKAMLEDAVANGSAANKDRASKLMDSLEIKGDKVMIPESPAERNATLQALYSLVMGHSVGKDSDVLSRFGAVKNKRAIEALARKLSEAPKSEEPKREERPTYDAEYIEKQHGAARAALEARDQDALEKILTQTYVGPLSPNLEMHRNLLETAAEDAAEMVRLFNLKRPSAARLAYSSLREKIKERAQDAAMNMLRNTPLRGMLGTVERVGAGRTTPAEFEGTLSKLSQVSDILQGYANLGSTSPVRDREKLTGADIARWADKILAQRVNMVTENLQKKAAEQERDLAYVQNADTVQEYINYAVSTGILADRGGAPSIYRDAEAFRKGAPAVVAALTSSVADIKGKLSDPEQVKREVFAEIKAQTNADRPNPVYMNRVIDRLLEAMQAVL